MRLILLCLLFIAATGCEEQQEPPPSNLLPQEKFVEVLTEVQILEGAYTHEFINLDDPDSVMMSHYREIFDRTGVDAASFESSLHYYRLDQELIVEIYDEVIDRITKREDQIKKDHGMIIDVDSK